MLQSVAVVSLGIETQTVLQSSSGSFHCALLDGMYSDLEARPVRPQDTLIQPFLRRIESARGFIQGELNCAQAQHVIAIAIMEPPLCEVGQGMQPQHHRNPGRKLSPFFETEKCLPLVEAVSHRGILH